MLTEEAVEAVKNLGRAKDPLLIAVLADFSEKRDVEQLLDHLYVIALESMAGGAEGALERAQAEAKAQVDRQASTAAQAAADARAAGGNEDDEEEAQQQEEELPASGPRSLRVSDVQQKMMIVEAMVEEKIIGELERQALEVLVLKEDRHLDAAFKSFFEAESSEARMSQLEKLSASLRSLAARELDRLRSSIAAEEEEEEGGAAAGAKSGQGTKTAVTITEEE